MKPSIADLTQDLLKRVHAVQQGVGGPNAAAGDAQARFSDLLDSMGMVEFLAILADDCGNQPGDIELLVGREFGTVAELAASLHQAGMLPRTFLSAAGGPASLSTPAGTPRELQEAAPAQDTPTGFWLAAAAACVADMEQSAAWLNERLHRPADWLQSHAGIHSRRVWADQDPLQAATAAGRECLERGHVSPREVGTLLVTSEAPPLLAGLAAALHHHLGLAATTPAFEAGGACTGFLAAAWMARTLIARVGVVLVIAVEAPSRYLELEPGLTGEAAALFGDAAAAGLFCANATGVEAVSVGDIRFGVDGSAASLLQVRREADKSIQLHMDGGALAGRAVETMAQLVLDLTKQRGTTPAALQAVAAHGGNGRLPGLLARRLGIAEDRVWSETPRLGNLGSASLPVAWAARSQGFSGRAVWTAVGAGLSWGAAILGET